MDAIGIIAVILLIAILFAYASSTGYPFLGFGIILLFIGYFTLGTFIAWEMAGLSGSFYFIVFSIVAISILYYMNWDAFKGRKSNRHKKK